MNRDIIEPTVDEHGSDSHPAFGMISAAAISSTPGEVLFDSDILHGRTVRITVQRATRRREISHDYIHSHGADLVEVELSQAQWASFVSSMNTVGVPCTIRRTETDWKIPGLPYNPRLAVSMREVREAAENSMTEIAEALAEYEALVESKAGARLRADALHNLHHKIKNAAPNVDYTSRKLAEHTENVVQKARADVEAMVTQKAVQLGLTTAEAAGLVALPAMPTDQPAAIEATTTDSEV